MKKNIQRKFSIWKTIFNFPSKMIAKDKKYQKLQKHLKIPTPDIFFQINSFPVRVPRQISISLNSIKKHHMKFYFMLLSHCTMPAINCQP